MSDEMLTIEQVETVIKRVLDEYGLASQSDLTNYVKVDDIATVKKEVSAGTERVKNLENRVGKLEELPLVVAEMKEQNNRIFDLTQNTNNMVMENARSTQRERERVDSLDKRMDSHQEATNKRFERVFDELHDISERSILTVENSKNTQAELKNVMKSVQETQSMMSKFLTHQALVQAETAQKDASREELFAWVRGRMRFEENTGKRIKAILEFLFKDRARAALTIIVASVPVLEPLVNIVKNVIGG